MGKRKIRMVCTVGTSAMTHFFKNEPKGAGNGDEKSEKIDSLMESFFRFKTKAQKRRFFTEHLEREKAGATWQTVTKAGVSPKTDIYKKIFPSAEMQSIMRWLDKQPEDEAPELEVVLLQNSGDLKEINKSVFTALVTEFFLEELGEKGKNLLRPVRFKILRKPVHIDVSNEENFLQSLGRLFTALDREREEAAAAGQEFLVNMSGGFKSISAYVMLYAQLRQIACLYTFEGGSFDAVELTSFPVSYALGALDEEMSLLRALEKSPEILKITADRKNALPLWVRSLVMTGKEGPEMPLLKILLDEYREKRRGGEAIGGGLLGLLKEGGGGDGLELGKYIEDRIRNEWAELWIGDQIPETVEHSRRHSKRLMEFAANLYRAAEEPLEKLGLTGPRAMALLISCIYLHDIGHTAISHPPAERGEPPFLLGSFPSSVREVHHLLSAELIRQRADELFPCSGKQDVSFLKTLTPLISAHHRGYTTLSEKQGRAKPSPKINLAGAFLFGKQDFEKTLMPLETKLQTLTEEQRGGLQVGVLLNIAALLRIIDGSDVQADRVVDEIYLEARLRRTKEEGRTFAAELRSVAGPFAKNAAFVKLLERVEKISAAGEKIAIKNVLEGRIPDKEHDAISANCEDVYETVFMELQQMKGRKKSPGRALRGRRQEAHFLSLANRAAFKWEQFLHFFKHQCVGTVFPTFSGGTVTVHVWPNGDLDYTGETFSKSLEGVKKDIEKEWSKACIVNGESILLPGLSFTVNLHNKGGN